MEKGELDRCLVNVEEPLLAMYNHAILTRDSFVFLFSTESPFSSRKYVTAQDLKGYPLILQNSDSALNTQLMKSLDQTGVTPNVQMYSSQLMTILNFVSQNQGGAFLYNSMITKDGHIGYEHTGSPLPESPLQREDLAIHSIPFQPEIRITFALVWAKGGYINRNVRTWISFVKETLTH
ncbi:MAG: LysR family transcriptional regulator substrate-binding protein [Bilifractor sp.]